MKRFLFVLTVWLLVSGVALAVPTVKVGQVDLEFTLKPNAELGALLGSDATFRSFCLELNEHVQLTKTYEATVNDEAVWGGGLRSGESPGPDGGDLLSPESAFLYTQFREGTLADYDYTPGSGREASAQDLQHAFWYLEGEEDYSLLSDGAKDFVTAAENSDWNGIGRVRVLNLWRLTDDKYGEEPARQDMLALVVPAPGALLLASMGMGLVGYLRRRRSL